jgi:hypothetical protein
MNEVAKDLLLLKSKGCKKIEWRFVPGVDGKVGRTALFASCCSRTASSTPCTCREDGVSPQPAMRKALLLRR